MQQKKAAESITERETRLVKRREAAKKITAEAIGKQNEYQRVYRQQRKAAESTNEKETCLSKQKETEMTTKAKGKENEYERVYNTN